MFADPSKAGLHTPGLVHHRLYIDAGFPVRFRHLCFNPRQKRLVIVAAGVGDAERVAEDPDSGLALLRVYGARDLAPLVLALDASKKGDITLVGIPDPKEQSGAKKLTEIKARLAGSNAIELRQSVPMAGFSGAVALDAQGQVLGLMEMRNFVLASVEPAAPPVRLITADTIRNFLVAHNVPPAQQAGDARASVVRIICVRK